MLRILKAAGLTAAKPALNQKIIDFSLPNQLDSILVRSDQELGGYSTAELEVKDGYATFHGNLNLDLPKNNPNVVQSGFAMFRTIQQKGTVFKAASLMDWSLSDQLLLRVRGDNRRYYVNIQAESVYPTDLFQHRLFLQTPGEWETVSIPLSDFILTNAGKIEEQQPMDLTQIKTLGIGLIDKRYGPFSLDIEWAKVAGGVKRPLTERVVDSPKERLSLEK